MTDQLDRAHPIPGTYVFDGHASRRGYRINKMSHSLNSDETREEYLAAEEAYWDKYGLSGEEKRLFRERDWLGIIKAGGNIYFVMKVAFLVGSGLYPMGAQQLGMTYEEFLATRNVKEAT
jgi:protocatechuate 4,5-dioxygenase alpha chain